jgi:translation elongation factor EF-G
MYTMESYGYEDVPSHLAQKIIQERGARHQNLKEK